MANELREAVLVVGVRPPHYERRDRDWVLAPFDSKAMEQFARRLGADIRRRPDFKWITTTFDVAAGTRTSSNPDKPEAAEELPKPSWERLRALYHSVDGSDYRVVVPGKVKETPKQATLTASTPGGGILSKPTLSTAATTPPVVHYF